MNRVLKCLVMDWLLTGCIVGPDYQQPKVSLPEQWHNQPGHSDSKKANIDEWWQIFHDPMLNQLLADGVASNLNFRNTLLRIKDARSQYSAVLAEGLPSLTARSNVSRRFNNTAGSSQSSESTAGGGFGFGNQLINIYQMGFDAQWEIDFFGGELRALEAAGATADAELENSRAVLVSLLGEIAVLYVDLRLNQQLMLIAQKDLTIRKDTLQLSEVRQQAGLANMLEVTQATAQVHEIEAELPSYQAVIAQDIHGLSILVGRAPDALYLRLVPSKALPTAEDAKISELPPELLQRRPDIRQAERQMAIANAQVGVATSELYPKINLAAFIGLQNLNISGFTPIGKSWSTAGSLSMPIFNWGKLNANLRSKRIQSEQTALNYQNVILIALKEVEDSLVAHNKEVERKNILIQTLDTRRLALDLAKELYQKGLSNFINVLDSQEALTQAKRELVATQALQAKHLISLYKALGGGWQNQAAAAIPVRPDFKLEL